MECRWPGRTQACGLYQYRRGRLCRPPLHSLFTGTFMRFAVRRQRKPLRRARTRQPRLYAKTPRRSMAYPNWLGLDGLEGVILEERPSPVRRDAGLTMGEPRAVNAHRSVTIQFTTSLTEPITHRYGRLWCVAPGTGVIMSGTARTLQPPLTNVDD